MTIKQICEDMGVSRSTVYRRLASGQGISEAVASARTRKQRPARGRQPSAGRLAISALLAGWRR